MKRRNFVKGLLGLTGLAASGASIAIEPKNPLAKNLVAGKGISLNSSPDIFISPIDYNVGDIVKGSDGHIYQAIANSNPLSDGVLFDHNMRRIEQEVY